MIEVQALLQPISDESPCGDDMSFSLEFDRIQEARREEDGSLDQGDWVRDVKEADWVRVNQLTEQLLQQHTKDFRVAGWLLEARVKLNGLDGLDDGLSLLTGLCEQYWNEAHPLIEGGDLHARAGNLAWIVNRVRDLARQVPLTDVHDAAYGIGHWEAANQLAHAIRRSPEDADSLSRGRVTLEVIQEARSRTTPAYFRTQFDALLRCQTSLSKLEQVLDSCLGDEGPSFSSLNATLEDIGNLLKRFASEAGVQLNTPPATVPEIDAIETASIRPARTEPILALPDAQATVVAPRPAADAKQAHLASRRQALEQLRAIAAFFRETEPHSPVAYLAQQAANWGELPLHEWLKKVLSKNQDALTGLQEQLGIESGGEILGETG